MTEQTPEVASAATGTKEALAADFFLDQLPASDLCYDLEQQDLLSFPAVTPDLENILGPESFQDADAERSLSFDQSFLSPEAFAPQQLSLDDARYAKHLQSAHEEPCLQAESAQAAPLPPYPTEHLPVHERTAVQPGEASTSLRRQPASTRAESSRYAPLVAESPFGSSTVQSASTIARPAQWMGLQQYNSQSSSFGFKQEPVDRDVIMLGPCHSGEFENPASPGSHIFSCRSGQLFDRGAQTALCTHEYRAHTVALGQRFSDVLEADKRRHSASPMYTPPARAASTPVCSAASTGRPMKRSRKAEKALRSTNGDELEWITQHATPKSILLPSQSRANFIRIVSGKGDFERPSWQSRSKVAARSNRLTIRSNELGKPGNTGFDLGLGDLGSAVSSRKHASVDLPLTRSVSGENDPNVKCRRTRAGTRLGALVSREWALPLPPGDVSLRDF